MSDSDDLPDIGLGPVGDSPQNRNAQISRLSRVASRFVERTQQIIQNPELSDSFAGRIATSFRTRRRQQNTRANDVLQVRVVCLRLPTQMSISRLNYAELSRYSLGTPPVSYLNERGLCTLRVQWTRQEVEEFLRNMFPVLNSTPFELCRSERGGRLSVIPESSRSSSGLRSFFIGNRRRLSTVPTLYVRPLELISHAPMGTPTLLSRVDDRDATRTEIEPIEETRRLRREQDEAYEESLRQDRERARRQRHQLEEERRRHRELQNLRASRREAVPPEPAEGVTLRFRFPDGSSSTRRFSTSMPMAAIVCAAGCHEAATERFFLRLPFSSTPLETSSLSGTLSDHNITTSAAVDIQWISDDGSSSSEGDAVVVNSSEEEGTGSDVSPSNEPSSSREPSTGREPSISQEPSTSQEPSARRVSAHSTSTEPAATQTSGSQQVIRVKIRRSCVIEDLIQAFDSNNVLNSTVKVDVTGEAAEDEDGVFRDILTDFWSKLMDRHFEGESQAAPRVSPAVTPRMWVAVGRIFRVGLLQLGYIPIRFGMASLIWILFNKVPDSMLLDCWIKSLAGFERELMGRLLQKSMQQDDVDDVVEIFDRYKVTTYPTSENIRSLSVRCAEVHFIENASFPLRQMQLRCLQTYFPSADSVVEIYDKLRPNGRKVASLLQGTPQNTSEQQVLDYMRQAIRSMDEDLLRKFLRFVSGSDVVNFSSITVQFVHLHGLSRRIVSHTCSTTVDLPVVYSSYNEFFTELKAQLSAGIWEMDIV